MIPRTKLAFALLVTVALAWLAAGCSKSNSSVEAKEPTGAPKARQTVTRGTTPAAKPVVLVQAFYPFHGHEFIIDYVKTLEKKYPGKVKVETYNMEETAGRKVWSKTGLGCAGVFVNGRTRHTIVRPNGKKETVDFLKRMDDFWSKADFETVLKQEIAHPSPLPPGGFSTGESATAGNKSGAKAAASEKPAKQGK